jgi:hypothetical protein
LSQWDGPQYQPPPYPAPRGSSWALPVILVLVGVLGIIGIGYGVLRVTRPQPTTSEGLPTGAETPAGGPPGGGASQVPDDAAHAMPSAPTLLGRCRADGEARDRAAAAKATFRVAFRDAAGYVVWIGSPTLDRVCAYRWGGAEELSPIGTSTGDTSDSDYVDRGLGLSTHIIASTGLDGDRRETILTGWVSKDVRRVVVKWAGGRPPTEAVLNHQYVLARLVDPDKEPGPIDKSCELEAYNAAGDLVGHQSCGIDT